jgi:hypothetical protein
VSVFTNEAYASVDWGAAAAAALRTFGEQIHGGLFDLEAGKEGLEYATATMFLRTEPSLLDQFIAALPALDAPDGGQAVLQCVPLPDDA